MSEDWGNEPLVTTSGQGWGNEPLVTTPTGQGAAAPDSGVPLDRFGVPQSRIKQADETLGAVDQFGRLLAKTTPIDWAIRGFDRLAAPVGIPPSAPGFEQLYGHVITAPVVAAVKGGQSMLGERDPPTPVDALTEASLGVGAPPVGRTAAGGVPVLRGVADAVESGGGVAGRGLTAAGRGATDLIGGIGTHTGGESLRQAFQAGREGGIKADLFLDALRGKQPMETVVATARDALAKMREARSAAYTSGMIDIKGDATQLSFDGIDKALAGIRSAAEYEGVTVNPQAAAALDEIRTAVNEWRAGDPTKFHTVAGFDALKQRIGAVLEQTAPHTRAATIAGHAYDAVRDEIVAQAPAYGKVMRDYEEASTALRELEGGLSLKDTRARQGTIDTSLRKLQSVMRNNAHTNYGYRLSLASDLDQKAGGTIMPQLAGQALSSLTPRGLGNVVAGGNVLAALSNPAAAFALPFQSPRIMGEAFYGMGALGRHISDVLEDLGIAGKAPPNAPP